MFPTLFTVGWHTFSSSGSDRNGNPIQTWTPALGSAGTAVAVHGWAPTQVDEPQQDHSLDLIDLFLPVGAVSAPGDVVDLPQGQFEVVGHPLDWSRGPFQPGWGGVVVKLRRYQ